jgi:hypothetical protein
LITFNWIDNQPSNNLEKISPENLASYKNLFKANVVLPNKDKQNSLKTGAPRPVLRFFNVVFPLKSPILQL